MKERKRRYEEGGDSSDGEDLEWTGKERKIEVDEDLVDSEEDKAPVAPVAFKRRAPRGRARQRGSTD